MLTVAEARAAVLERMRPLAGCRRLISESAGLMLAEAIVADLDLPPFDKALMDGYAIRTADLASIHRLRVIEQVTAGRLPTLPLGLGEATEIMTGAAVPPAADAVVMIERTRREDAFVVIDDSAIVPGRNILFQGREMRKGERIARQGERLNPARLGLLASVGRTEVLVVPRPRVVIVPTGDELVEPELIPGPGQIRNSNATMLEALAKLAGAEVETMPIVPDDLRALNHSFSKALSADVVLITGGVSAGKLDLVPRARPHNRSDRGVS